MKVIKALLAAVLLVVSVLSVVVYGAKGHHYLELLSHFRTQYLFVQTLCLLALLLLRSWRLSVVALLCTLINLVPIAPYYFPGEKIANSGAIRIKVLQINLYGPNQDHQTVLGYIAKVDPDIIGAEEVRPHWGSALESALKAYPYRVVEPEKTAFGIALFSKLPLGKVQIVRYGDPYGPNKRYFPSIVAETKVDGEPVTLIVTHPLPPMRGFAVRNSQLADIARKRPTFNDNLIVIGDLNVTPWSPYFQNFIKQTGLRDTQLGFGVQSSWESPIPGVMIPIDHVLTSPKFHVLDRQLGPDIGSDHRPVVVDIAFKGGKT